MSSDVTPSTHSSDGAEPARSTARGTSTRGDPWRSSCSERTRPMRRACAPGSFVRRRSAADSLMPAWSPCSTSTSWTDAPIWSWSSSRGPDLREVLDAAPPRARERIAAVFGGILDGLDAVHEERHHPSRPQAGQRQGPGWRSREAPQTSAFRAARRPDRDAPDRARHVRRHAGVRVSRADRRSRGGDGLGPLLRGSECSSRRSHGRHPFASDSSRGYLRGHLKRRPPRSSPRCGLS